MKTFDEWIKEYRSGVNPITGEPNLYRDLNDQQVWDAAQEEIIKHFLPESTRLNEVVAVLLRFIGEIYKEEAPEYPDDYEEGWVHGFNDALDTIIKGINRRN